MNIESKDLRSWLNFDSSPTLDVGGYTWAATGSPTTSTSHAFNGTALQLNGSTYLKTNGYRQVPSQYDPSVLVNAEVIDWTGSWTIDFWLYLDPSSPSTSRILAVTNSYYGNTYFNVRTNGRRLELWVNTGSDLAANVDSGQTITNNTTIPTDRPCHVALTYNDEPKGSTYVAYSKMTLYVDGVGVSTADSSTTGSEKYRLNTSATPKQHSEVWVGAKWGDGSQGMVGAIDELRIRNGLAWTADFSGSLPTADDYLWEVFADTERDVYPKPVNFTLDVIRMTSAPASAWRYENIGTTNGLLDTTTAVYLTGLPSTMSTTGEAFCQTGRSVKLFDVPNSTEYWVRFDMYHADMDSVFCGDYLGNDPDDYSSAHVGLYTYGDSYNEQDIYARIGDDNDSAFAYTYALEYGRLESFIVHLKAGVDDGAVEVYVNPQGRDLGEDMTNPVVCEGNVNDGNAFAHLTLATERSFVPHEDPETEEEVCPNLFSNIVISNQPLWWDDGTVHHVQLVLDVERELTTTAQAPVQATSINYGGLPVVTPPSSGKYVPVILQGWSFDNDDLVSTNMAVVPAAADVTGNYAVLTNGTFLVTTATPNS